MALDDYIATHPAGGQVVGQGILQESATPNSPLGKRLVLGDGREFIYCKNSSTALDPGKLVQSPAWVSTEVNLATDNDTGGLGTTSVLITTGSTVAADTYAEGFVFIDTSTGAGSALKIKSHPTLASAEGAFVLYDPVPVAWGDSTTVSLVKCPYKEVVVAIDTSGTETGSPVGVPLIPVSASYYFWAQTKGVSVVWIEGTVAVGVPLMQGSTAGAVAAGDSTMAELGTQMNSSTSTEYTGIMLDI